MEDPGTCLWTLAREGRQVSCIVRLVRLGIEIDIAYDGAPIVTRAFETPAEALDWADKTKSDRVARGWQS